MAAPKGNRFWEVRATHGRDRLFATPDAMWEGACEYFEWCEENPMIEIDFMGKDIERVEIPHSRPFTMEGLCRFLDCNTVYFNQFYIKVKDKTDEESLGFSKVIKKIRETIYDQKFSGAAAGFFNANIIARDLGLVDKKESTVEIKPVVIDWDNDDKPDPPILLILFNVRRN